MNEERVPVPLFLKVKDLELYRLASQLAAQRGIDAAEAYIALQAIKLIAGAFLGDPEVI